MTADIGGSADFRSDATRLASDVTNGPPLETVPAPEEAGEAEMPDSIPLDELQRMRDESHRALERARRELERLEAIIRTRDRSQMALHPSSVLDPALFPPTE